MREVSVLIVGGGPVGLIGALECAYFGIPALLVERNASTTWHPKARNLNTRTMEIMRRLGLEDDLNDVALAASWTRQIIYTATLSGQQIGVMPTAGFASDGTLASPCTPVLSSQDIFEPIWRAHAEQSPFVEVRFGHEAEVLDVAADGVVVRIKGAEPEEVRARFLLAADGAESTIRGMLGIDLDGPRNIGHFINVYYRANLHRFTGHRPAILYFTSQPDGRGVFQPLDGRHRWLSQINYDGSDEERASFDAERCIEWIRNAAGDQTLQPRILGIADWTMNATVAAGYRRGAAFLVGDSAHQLPPTGGFGLNTGIQDVHNLVWKIAYVLRGWASTSLLDSYEAERKPVARFNAEKARDNSRIVAAIQRAASEERSAEAANAVSGSRRYGNFAGLELGFSYRSSAVIDDGSKAAAVVDDVEDYRPDARPGSRLPHLWLDGGRCSILDLVQSRFLVLTDSSRWLPAAGRLNMDCRVIPGGPAVTDLFGFSGGAVLVRPDGHVAARFNEPADAPGELLASTMMDLLE